MTPLESAWKDLKFVSEPEGLTEEQIRVLVPVLEEERKARQARRVKALLKSSGIHPARIKRIEDFDWVFNPRIPRKDFLRFRNSDWIAEARNLVLIGPTGVGKTHLADGLCLDAVQRGIAVARITCNDLVAKLRTSKNRHATVRYFAAVKVFCLDELGYTFPSPEEANDIFQIVSKRSEILPTLVTTNLVPSKWGCIFEAATASAILDRLNHKGSFLTMEGKSYRSR